MKSVIYLSEIVENKKRNFGALKKYNYVKIIDDRDDTQLYFDGFITNREIHKFVKRANKNPEDIPKVKSFFKKLFG